MTDPRFGLMASRLRLLATWIAVLFFGMQGARAEEDSNYSYSLSFQGGMTMTRYAKPDHVQAMRPTRPHGVSIVWSMDVDDDDAAATIQRDIDAINEVVAKALAAQPDAVLALQSIRRNSQGVWAFYTSDGDSLATWLDANLKGKTKTPVRLRSGKDPEWKALGAFLGRLDK